MTRRCPRAAAFFLLATISFVLGAEADPVTVTSGQFRLNAHDTPVFDFRGDSFVLPGVTFDQPNPIPTGIFPFQDCLACSVGDSIRLSSDIQEHELARTAGTAAQFGGVTYDPSTQPLFYSGELQFQSTTVTVPPEFTGFFLTFEKPFTFTGTLMAFLSPQRTGLPVFTADLTGSGVAKFELIPGAPGQFNFADLTYTFDTASPIPEPATVTLLGSGIIGMLLHRRRRRG